MRTMFMGVTAGLLLGTAGVGTALAQSTTSSTSTTQHKQKHEASETKEQERAEGHEHHAANEHNEHHVMGKITSIKGDTVTVQGHDGAVALKVGKDTHFRDVKKGHTAEQTLNNDFREGQEVRASYRVEGSTNMARMLAPEQSPSHSSSTKAEKPASTK
ncbi:hypothetical protein FGE12_13110 [Aggregicoccus sp. 17bor-14]|uniref:hypothetical protein n=1 Tax=Myxococcaceae TaxID=31 RepID=UPI00129CED40|nr:MULTISPECIES: hypothetical protein [Myxococcaceae]MBF5043330.1 hypothetical protein [Simulacricoccus sp. 17bor-14]MRI89089.1 hypothetical protein [Aggregicoccus sp. 17bor-14]